MPPTNDTGSVLVVGPDAEGNHFEVDPGDDYELPEPPLSVPAEDPPAPAEEEPDEVPPGDKPDEVPPGDKPDEVPPGDEVNPLPDPNSTDTEGAQA